MDRNTASSAERQEADNVVPYVGTWIEISSGSISLYRGQVVPYVGTWIEIPLRDMLLEPQMCRSLRGNVDRNETLV